MNLLFYKVHVNKLTRASWLDSSVGQGSAPFDKTRKFIRIPDTGNSALHPLLLHIAIAQSSYRLQSALNSS